MFAVTASHGLTNTTRLPQSGQYIWLDSEYVCTVEESVFYARKGNVSATGQLVSDHMSLSTWMGVVKGTGQWSLCITMGPL
ncbi:hypothetical protein Ddc_08180 [Ditylenchus destructor]|nr:hypothetical protein Ddc_08180 [Ditylenchus destructor]